MPGEADVFQWTYYVQAESLAPEHWLMVTVDKQMEQMTPEQRARLIAWWAAKWGPS